MIGFDYEIQPCKRTLLWWIQKVWLVEYADSFSGRQQYSNWFSKEFRTLVSDISPELANYIIYDEKIIFKDEISELNMFD